MYERFTDRARKIMQLANQEAARYKHEYIGTEHILLGLLTEGTGVAANVLKNLEIDLMGVRREVEKIIQPGPEAVTMGRLPQTPRAKKVIEYAIQEAHNLGHNYVGTEHLLLGLVREVEGLAAQVLMNRGVRLEMVRAEVLNMLGHNEPLPPAQPRQDVVLDLDDISPEVQHLPEPAREIAEEFDCQIDVVRAEKDEAVAAGDLKRAGQLRDLEFKLRKLRDEFLCHWPKSGGKPG